MDGKCKACQKNSITESLGSFAADACECEPGYESINDECTECPVGSFKTFTGNTGCTKCSNNEETSASGMISYLACACAEGYEKIAGICQRCGKGFYKPFVSDNISCFKCPENSTTKNFGSKSKE